MRRRQGRGSGGRKRRRLSLECGRLIGKAYLKRSSLNAHTYRRVLTKRMSLPAWQRASAEGLRTVCDRIGPKRRWFSSLLPEDTGKPEKPGIMQFPDHLREKRMRGNFDPITSSPLVAKVVAAMVKGDR